MTGAELRPLSLGELLDRAFTLYRRHFWLFVGVMAVPSVLALTLGLISTWFQQVVRTAALAPPGPARAAEVVAMMAGFSAAMVVLVLAYLVVYMIALGAISFAVSELYVGRSVTVADVYRRMRG